jgi:hypothetical protein
MLKINDKPTILAFLPDFIWKTISFCAVDSGFIVPNGIYICVYAIPNGFECSYF